MFCKVQRSLKLKIEAQGKYLERIEQSYNQSKTITGKACKPSVAEIAPLSTRSEKSKSLETPLEEEHRSTKKQRITDEGVFPTSCFELGSLSTTPELCNQTWNLSWSQLAAVAYQSPLVPGFLL